MKDHSRRVTDPNHTRKTYTMTITTPSKDPTMPAQSLPPRHLIATKLVVTAGHLVSAPEAALLPLGLGTHGSHGTHGTHGTHGIHGIHGIHGTHANIAFPAHCTRLLCHIHLYTSLMILPYITSFGS